VDNTRLGNTGSLNGEKSSWHAFIGPQGMGGLRHSAFFTMFEVFV